MTRYPLLALTLLLNLLVITPIKANNSTETAIFAGGCFWCMEPPFDKLTGVISTTSGYTGGHLKNPTYQDTLTGTSGHLEAVKIVYDPKKIGYSQLLEVYWKNIDPTDDGGQFCDRGSSYRSAIFFSSQEQREAAEQSKQSLLKRKIVPVIKTLIRPSTTFYPAETYHQDYYKKNPLTYKYYRYTCGRDKRLKELYSTNH